MTVAPTFTERPVWLPGRDGPLLAVTTYPSEPAAGAVLLCPGGWHGTNTNRNRLLVRLARRLADHGHIALRFDWHGVGESHGELTRYDLDTPFVADVLTATQHLSAAGFDRVTLVGVCFGAHTALAAAPRMLTHVDRVALVSFPVPDRAPQRAGEASPVEMMRLAARAPVLQSMTDRSARQLYRRKLRSRWRRARGRGSGQADARPRHGFDATQVRNRLQALVDADIPTLLLFGETDPYFVALQRHRAAVLDPLVGRVGNRLLVETEPVDLQGFSSVAAQDAAITRTTAFVTDKGLGIAH